MFLLQRFRLEAQYAIVNQQLIIDKTEIKYASFCDPMSVRDNHTT